MAKYRLYVDEVGDGGLRYVRDRQHRFLSMTGVIAESDHVRDQIHPQLETIKKRYFDSHPDEPVVLHRKELVNATWPFQALRDSETRAAFDTELFALIRDWDYQVLTACLERFADCRLNRTPVAQRYFERAWPPLPASIPLRVGNYRHTGNQVLGSGWGDCEQALHSIKKRLRKAPFPAAIRSAPLRPNVRIDTTLAKWPVGCPVGNPPDAYPL